MSIQESGEMYLETILILSRKGPLVRAIDVGEYMGFSKPSVSRAIGVLKKGGYVTVDPHGHLSLTAQGRALAEKIYERHSVLSEFLIAIGVDGTVATEDACKIEHDISDESMNAIKEHLARLKDR